jgi:DNA segregation ATPase FtsK/SpoIIIE, S-DNA-T family
MILERKVRVAPAASDPSALAEIKRLVWLAAALYLFFALASYSPTDPSWTTWTTKNHFQNWMGRAGSGLADLLYQVLGLAAFGLCALFAMAALRPAKSKLAKLAWVPNGLLLVSFALLLQASLPVKWVPWNLSHAGGLLGRVSYDALSYVTGPNGAVFFAIFSSITALVLSFKIRMVDFFASFLQAMGASLRKAYKRALKIKIELPRLALPKWAFARKASSSELKTAPTIAPAIAPEPYPMAPIAVTPPIQLSLSPLSPEPALMPLPVAAIEKDMEMDKLSTVKGATAHRDARPKNRGKNGPFTLPSLSLLSGKAESKSKPVDRNWFLEKSKILVEKLRDFGVDGEVVNISPGPVITVYEFKPASGVKIKEIANLSDDLTLALSVLSVRIVAPIPGKPVVGIEIPSPHREMVFFKDIVEETPFNSSDVKLPLVLGRMASGEPAIAGLAAMPHLLVAGSTGTGKSVFINTMICSLLFRYTPQQLKLILVDPKMVELAAYEGIPHLLLPVVVDSRKAALALRWAVEEMERRYALMHKLGVRQIDSYNDRLAESGTESEETPFMPYIVVVVDEYADLMAVVPKDVELSIARLAQKARASGIHLVLATQRPSTDVVTGTIKANFPSRLSFRVASSIDSKTILDRTGADRLLGNGDLLFHSAGFTTLKRIQGAYISDADLDKVTNSLRAQGEPEYDERLLKAQEESDEFGDGESSGSGNGDEGNLYDRAVRLVTEKGEASISLIQRHLRIGYNRAATLMEEMEKQGVVAGSASPSKRRTVLVNSI